MQNGFIESFNGGLRDECLNANWFERLADAPPLCLRVGDRCRDGQTHFRARSSLGPEIQFGADSFRPFANSL